MEISTQKLHLRQLPSGDELFLRVYEIGDGRPHAYLQANVHGNEVQGCWVLAHWLEQLRTLPASALRGKLTIVPNANPVGLNNKVGESTVGPFDLLTGENWNRCYPNILQGSFAPMPEQFDTQPRDWAYTQTQYRQALQNTLRQRQQDMHSRHGLRFHEQQAYRLLALAFEADIVLDLHTSTVGTRFVYAPLSALSLAAQLNADYVLRMDDVCHGALDEAFNHPWLQLAKRGAAPASAPDLPCAMTLELGSQEVVDHTQLAFDIAGIERLLRYAGVLADDKSATAGAKNSGQKSRWFADAHDYLTVCAPHGGLCRFLVRPGDHVSAGAALAEIINLNDLMEGLSQARHVVRAPRDGIVLAHYPSSIVASGVDLIKIMTRAEMKAF